MRPSSRPTGEVWRLLEEWSAAHPLHPNQSQMAGLFGISNSLMSNWKYMQSRMQTDDMVTVAEATGIAIEDLSRAALADLPAVLEHIVGRREAYDVTEAAAARARKSAGKGRRVTQDEDAERADQPGDELGA